MQKMQGKEESKNIIEREKEKDNKKRAAKKGNT